MIQHLAGERAANVTYSSSDADVPLAPTNFRDILHPQRGPISGNVRESWKFSLLREFTSNSVPGDCSRVVQAVLWD